MGVGQSFFPQGCAHLRYGVDMRMSAPGEKTLPGQQRQKERGTQYETKNQPFMLRPCPLLPDLDVHPGHRTQLSGFGVSLSIGFLRSGLLFQRRGLPGETILEHNGLCVRQWEYSAEGADFPLPGHACGTGVADRQRPGGEEEGFLGSRGESFHRGNCSIPDDELDVVLQMVCAGGDVDVDGNKHHHEQVCGEYGASCPSQGWVSLVGTAFFPNREGGATLFLLAMEKRGVCSSP